jgi:hypothetical protein
VTGKKITLCYSCLFKDNRTELGVEGGGLIYCSKKERVVRPKIECELFAQSTDKSREEMRNSLYGTFSGEEEG